MANKKYILLVEDNELIANGYAEFLQEYGYEVEIAQHGGAALKKMKKRTPDLILLDIIMPNKDGFQVLEEMRTKDQFKDIPVMCLTNLAQDLDKERAKNLGVVDYLVKSDNALTDITDKLDGFFGK